MMQKPNPMDYPMTIDGDLQYQTDLEVWRSQQREKLKRSDEQTAREQFAPPPDTIQVSRAEYEALRRDAERLNHLERESSVNFDYENCILTFEVPDDFQGCNSIRAAIDAAINMTTNGEGGE
jgi:hypothetical protein